MMDSRAAKLAAFERISKARVATPLGLFSLIAASTGVFALVVILTGILVPANAQAGEGASRAAGTPLATDKTPGTKKPASEKRKSTLASVTLTHLRRQITSCHRVQEEGKSVCDAAGYSEQSGGASIHLSPLTKSGTLDTSGSRSEREVTFKQAQGQQTEQVRLERGRWELSWKDGSTLRERFFVVARDNFEIALESIGGMCVEDRQSCKLEPGKRQRSIEIPKVRALQN